MIEVKIVVTSLGMGIDLEGAQGSLMKWWKMFWILISLVVIWMHTYEKVHQSEHLNFVNFTHAVPQFLKIKSYEKKSGNLILNYLKSCILSTWLNKGLAT